ncbi:MAG TPA: glycosyltransferase [Candidatus Methylacidiphilales bacterium]|jgi:glycosyltransferase involved in cell wall biosynthesis|nr:glycosyltransferase [Candidatus Methylacidiphilales bacterium]
MPLITFLICSWKAPASLDDTLQSVAAQPSPHLFETLLVNNGFSDQRSAALLETYPRINLRIIREPTPGLAHARCAGFAQALGEIIVMIDDDNSLGENFVPGLADLFEKYPKLGGICPLILPVWQEPPPSWVPKIGSMCLSYTANDLSQAPKETQYWPPGDASRAPRPPGGGMIIHRDVVACYSARLSASARANAAAGATRIKRLHDGHDMAQDHSLYDHIRFTGRGALVAPVLTVYHHIPSSRWRIRALCRLNYTLCYFYARWQTLNGLNTTSWKREIWNFIKSILKLPASVLPGRDSYPYSLCIVVRHAGRLVGRFSALRDRD